MSRTIRKVNPYFASGDSAKEYARDGKKGGFFVSSGYRSGSNGFNKSGNPTGWDDDLPRDRQTRKYVNTRRRAWDKKITREQRDL